MKRIELIVDFVAGCVMRDRPGTSSTDERLLAISSLADDRFADESFTVP